MLGVLRRQDNLPNQLMPYQVQLDMGRLIYAPSDEDACIRAERDQGQEVSLATIKEVCRPFLWREFPEFRGPGFESHVDAAAHTMKRRYCSAGLRAWLAEERGMQLEHQDEEEERRRELERAHNETERAQSAQSAARRSKEREDHRAACAEQSRARQLENIERKQLREAADVRLQTMLDRLHDMEPEVAQAARRAACYQLLGGQEAGGTPRGDTAADGWGTIVCCMCAPGPIICARMRSMCACTGEARGGARARGGRGAAAGAGGRGRR